MLTSRLMALVLALAMPGLALADAPTDFIRYKEGKTQADGALQIAKATYVSDKTGVKVVLYGVVHIGDMAYYHRIQKDLDSYTAVLYEGVKPPKDMKPRDIKPVTMKVIPSPSRPSGTSEYLSFSRMPARATMASAQPTPEPAPNATLSAKL